MPKELIYAVEDEAHIQQLIKYNLEAGGYRVMTFDSGESLLKECESSIPDLFILDIMLPGIDGFMSVKSSNKTAIPGIFPSLC
jgi:two-component system alkaline phosphatase synthesis response regulator PhoP